MSRKKSDTSLVSIVVFTVSIVIIISLVKSALEFYEARDRLDKMREESLELEAERQKLAQQLQLAQDPASLELSIRDKLNVSLPGETVVVMSDGNQGIVPPEPVSASVSTIPPYLQWWHLLTSRE